MTTNFSSSDEAGSNNMKNSTSSTKVRKSEREKSHITYVEGNIVDEFKWSKLLKSKNIPMDSKYVRVVEDGHSMTLDWLKENGFTIPCIVKAPDGLDMKMPPSNITVNEIADY
ncbi:hypothetical protein BC833DRAFT_5342 [Globomyces pollinis-pini]|nr:hypothetical protein BC833DRAFT_5342 [Globomyces pollinis-pini]